MKSTPKTVSLATLILACLGATAAHAHTGWAPHSPGTLMHRSDASAAQIEARQAQQGQRIRAGLRDGSLTPSEFRRLMAEQRDIAAMKRDFHADGVLDGREFRRLNRALDDAGQAIWRERHDGQVRTAYKAPRFE